VREPEGILGSGPRTSAERFIRMLKENLLWLHRFAAIEELRRALHALKAACNRTWTVGRHGDRTPARLRAEQLAVLATAA